MQIVETQRNIRRYTKLTLISSTNCLVTLFVCVFFVMSLQPVVFSQDSAPLGAPLTIYEMELYYDDWPEARRTDSVLELVVMRDLLSLFDEEKGQIIIPSETIKYIAETLTDNEKGVRNLKRCLEIIYTKLNLYRLMKEGSTLFNKEETIKVKFPFTVTKEIVQKLIKKTNNNGAPFGMYM